MVWIFAFVPHKSNY